MIFFLYKERNCPFSLGDIESYRYQVRRRDAFHYSRQVREIIYVLPVTRKGTSWVSYSEIHFFRVLNREFYDESRNINMLMGS